MTTDPLGLRPHAPLLDAWLRFRETACTPFTIPGHKQRTDLVGDVTAGDVPYYAGLDTMKLTGGVLDDAQRRAAALWGADVAYFSVGGSTHCNQALALAVGQPGDTVLVQRTLHRSMLLGLVLAGLEPVWLAPSVDPATGLPLGVAPATLDAALVQNPHARAVFVTDPAYVGTVGDVRALAQLAHAQDVPLIVDAAWAAHFGFHPGLPGHALQQGADALVTSAHKTLPAWSQGALILARTRRLDPLRLSSAVDATHTTSPAGAIFASIDASRALLERHGERLLGQSIDVVRAARDPLSSVPGLIVLDGPNVDPLKLTLLLPGTGADGNRIEAGLIERGMPVELADRDTIVAMISLADDQVCVDGLVDALLELIPQASGPGRAVATAGWVVEPEQACSPREAYFAPDEAVPFDAARGRVCAELIAPYPPGIPVLTPGERVTDAALDALTRARHSGVRIAYAADPSLATLRVLR